METTAPAPRAIPGLAPTKLAATVGSKQHKRSKKAQKTTTTTTDVAAAVESDNVVHTETAPQAEELNEALVAQPEDIEEEKKTSAVEAVNKRIRAANKKLQRIKEYENKTESLNADQQKAVASKPTLEAVVKELQELLVILKAEEQEENARLARIKQFHDRKHKADVQAAVKAAQKQSQSDLVLLCQFLHLRSLYAPSGNQFAPPQLPAVVANATGQEVAAVHSLYEAFSNGPLLGGHDDALEKLAKIAQGSQDQVLEGVPYARVKELIEGLTSPPSADAPAEQSLPHHNGGGDETPQVNSSAPAGPSDSVTALVDGGAEQTPSFMQESEIIPAVDDTPLEQQQQQQQQPAAAAEPVQSTEEKVASWADEVEDAHAPPPPAAPTTTAPDSQAWGTEPSAPAAAAPQAEPRGGERKGGRRDHRNNNNNNGHPKASLEPDADGFQPARPSKPTRGSFRGNGERGGRGGGRGSGRGGGRGAGAGAGPRGSDGERSSGETGGQRRGGPRGEGGRGRGRGRGGPRKEGGDVSTPPVPAA